MHCSVCVCICVDLLCEGGLGTDSPIGLILDQASLGQTLSLSACALNLLHQSHSCFRNTVSVCYIIPDTHRKHPPSLHIALSLCTLTVSLLSILQHSETCCYHVYCSTDSTGLLLIRSQNARVVTVSLARA